MHQKFYVVPQKFIKKRGVHRVLLCPKKFIKKMQIVGLWYNKNNIT